MKSKLRKVLVGIITFAVLGVTAAVPAFAADKVVISYIGGAADVGIYIADAKGFLKEEGIEAELIVFDSSARMVASPARAARAFPLNEPP